MGIYNKNMIFGGKLNMSYEIEIIRKDEQSTSIWSGGTTTQLAIYPRYSDYKERNFKWRLSSARVDVEESVFTNLPGIWRHIMVIEGELMLQHEGHHNVSLKPFQQDSFSGAWTTRSKGQVRDFNLMLGQGCNGELEAILMDKGVKNSVAIEPKSTGGGYCTEGFYCTAGSIEVHVNQNRICSLEAGDLILINYLIPDESVSIVLNNAGGEDAAIIRVRIG